MASKQDKKQVVHTIISLLNSIAARPVTHKSIVPYVLTPYDAYMVFIEEAKQSVPREILNRLQPGSESDPIEKILTPNLVCALAWERLNKILSMT